MKKIIHLGILLCFCSTATKSFSQGNNRIRIGDLYCQLLKDCFSKKTKENKLIYLKSTLDTANENERLLQRYVPRKKSSYSRITEEKQTSINLLNCNLSNIHIIDREEQYDSLAVLFALAEDYEILKEVYEDSIALPAKPKVNYIPIEISYPAIYKDSAVISTKISSSTNYFLYAKIDNKWRLVKVLYDPR